MVHWTPPEHLGKLSEAQVKDVVDTGLKAALLDPRTLRAAGELLPDALDGNVRALMKKVRATADRGDSAYARIWGEIEKALVDRGLVDGPDAADGAGAAPASSAPGAKVDGKPAGRAKAVAASWRPLETPSGAVQPDEVLAACRTYANIRQGASAESTALYMLGTSEQRKQNVADFLGVEVAALEDYLASGAWRKEPWLGVPLKSTRGVLVPAELILKQKLGGKSEENIAELFSLDKDKLDTWLTSRAWLDETAKLPKGYKVELPEISVEMPASVQWRLEGAEKKLSGAEVMKLYAAAARLTLVDAYAEVEARQPRAEIVEALARYVGTSNETVQRWFTGGLWGKLARATGDALESNGKKIAAGDVLAAYLEHDPEQAGKMLGRWSRNYGDGYVPNGAAVRKAAEALGVKSADLVDYLTNETWRGEWESLSDALPPADIFEPISTRSWIAGAKEAEEKSYALMDLIYDEPGRRDYSDDRDMRQMLSAETIGPKEIERLAKRDYPQNGYYSTKTQAAEKFEVKGGFPKLKALPAFELSDDLVARAYLDGGSQAVRSIFEAQALAEAKGKKPAKDADESFRWALFNAHRRWVRSNLGTHSRYDQNDWKRQAAKYTHSSTSAVQPPLSLKKAFEALEKRDVDDLGANRAAIARAPAAKSMSAVDLLAGISRSNGDTDAGTAAAAAAVKQKRANGPKSEALAKLEDLEGLDSVKRNMRELVALVKQQKQREAHGLKPVPMSLHARFEGNPGTGKTTVARLYGEALKDVGFLEKGHLVEVGGAELLTGGVAAIEAKIREAIGGVLIIDELYQLNPKSNPIGRDIANYLLKAMEDHRHELVVIGTGYSKEMEEFVAWNDGFTRRFAQKFDFEDYSNDQLGRIMNKMVAAHGYEVDPVLTERAIHKIARARGPGFGNAGAVRNLFEAAIRRQGLRLDAAEERGVQLEDADYKKLIPDDVLGPSLEAAFGPLPSLEKLDKMIGLDEVKEQVHALVDMLRLNAQREELGQPAALPPLHAVFSGNPGTGKTTVAKLYGQTLKELGYLSNGEVMVVKREDLVGTVVGETETKVKKVLERARGKVLVIDEAYALYSKAENDYGRIALDQLVANIQGTPGEDICVIMTGYTKQMDELMRKANPGLARRFAQRFHFSDYKDEALGKILDMKAGERGLGMDADARKQAISFLARERAKPNFGNAGAVDNLLNKAVERQSARLAKEGGPATGEKLKLLTAKDLVGDAGSKVDEAGAGLDKLIGLTEVKEKVAEYKALIEQAKARGDDPLEYFEPAFVFAGNHGAGKRTVAREMASVFNDLGFLATKEVVEVAAGDFMAGYIGQTAGKADDLLESALGKTLVIRQAHGLGDPRNPYANEAVERITKFMAEHRGELSVILTGTEEQMDVLFDRSPDLRRAFTERLAFADLSPKDAGDLLKEKLAEKKFTLAPEALKAMPLSMEALAGSGDFANGADVTALVSKIVRKQAVRVTREKAKDRSLITAADVKAGLDDLLSSKRDSASRRPAAAADGAASDDVRLATDAAPPPPKVQAKTSNATQAADGVAAPDAAGGPTKIDALGLLRKIESVAADAGLSPDDVLKGLKGGKLPGVLASALAANLGITVDELTKLISDNKIEINNKLEEQVKKAIKQAKTEWVCGVCGNSNPDCPYKAEKVGGFYRQVKDA